MMTSPMESNKTSAGKEPLKKTKTKDDSLPPKPFTDYLVYFRLERVRLLQSIGCDDVTTGYDPDHHDPLEHPRPPRYEDVELPPYWYSGTIAWEQAKKGELPLAPPRKHRKRANGMSLAELSRTISSSWKNVDREVAAYCNKLSKVDAAKYKEAMEKVLQESAAEKKETSEKGGAGEDAAVQETQGNLAASGELPPSFNRSTEAASGTPFVNDHCASMHLAYKDVHQAPVLFGIQNNNPPPICHALGMPFSATMGICMSTPHQPSYPTKSNFENTSKVQQQHQLRNFVCPASSVSLHAAGINDMEVTNHFFCEEIATNFNSSSSPNEFSERHVDGISKKLRDSFVCHQTACNVITTDPSNQFGEYDVDEYPPMKRRASFVCVPEWRVEDAMSLILALSPDVDSKPHAPCQPTQGTSSSDNLECGNELLDFDVDKIFD
mmetsp:Transcript_18960/g.38556  ORF Transcript_18960/g.38556 Transcript_18960/m.38556 type:complete len:437 (-) Transcript_18960:145-1455(-)